MNVRKLFKILAGIAKTESEGITMFMDSFLLKHWKEEFTQNWRERRYWNEECDNLIKVFKSMFEYLWKSYGGGVRKPGEK
jgi:hypothetical protein